MEADLETLSPVGAVGPGPRHKHASSVSTLSNSTAIPSPTTPSSRPRSSTSPDDGAVKRMVDHDSLVSIRLSEPPARQLTLNTNIPPTNGAGSPAVQSSRRSLFTNSLSPGSTRPTPLGSPLDPNEDLSPVTSISSSRLRTNLQDELDGADDDSKTISGAEVEDSDDEEVDWDELQKTEDAESKVSEEDVGLAATALKPSLEMGFSDWLFTDNDFLADYCYAVGPTRTGKRGAGYEPQERQGAGRREVTTICQKTTATLDGAITKYGAGPSARTSTILDAATAPDDGSRILRGPREGLSPDSGPSAHALDQQDPERHSPAPSRSGLAKHVRGT